MPRKLQTNAAKIDSPLIYGTGLTDLAISALYAGGFVLLLSLSLSITIWAIWEVPIPALVFISVALSLGVAGGLGFYRMLAVERDGRVNTQELQRRRVFEDADWGQVSDIAEDRRMGREPNASRLDSVARRIMRRYYAGKSISRAACTGDSICTHAEWNKCNDLLKSRGVRAGRLLVPDSYSAALVAWYEGEARVRRFAFVDGEMVARE